MGVSKVRIPWISVLARLRAPKLPAFEFAFRLDPIIQLMACFFAALEIDFVGATSENSAELPRRAHGTPVPEWRVSTPTELRMLPQNSAEDCGGEACLGLHSPGCRED
jgi:hypothetical protein